MIYVANPEWPQYETDQTNWVILHIPPSYAIHDTKLDLIIAKGTKAECIQYMFREHTKVHVKGVSTSPHNVSWDCDGVISTISKDGSVKLWIKKPDGDIEKVWFDSSVEMVVLDLYE